MTRYVRVLVVDDSALARDVLTDALNADSEIIVVGHAQDGTEAIASTRRLHPDLITMDVSMPGLDGFEAVRQIMAAQPTPILVVTAAPLRRTDVVPRMLAAGALDVIEKPSIASPSWERQRNDLVQRVKLLAGVRVVTHIQGRQPISPPLGVADGQPPRASWRPPDRRQLPRVVAMVASTGGPPALGRIFSGLPRDFAAGIVVVQHIAPGFTPGLVDWFRSVTALQVKVGEAGDRVRPGVIIVAPEGVHTRVGRDGAIQFSSEPSTTILRPSGDVLLESLTHMGRNVIGVVLTGMGDDGARGLDAIHRSGGHTIAQDERTSTIYGMPRAAVESGAADEIVSLAEIAGRLVELVGRPTVSTAERDRD